MSIIATSFSKKDLFIYQTTAFDDRPTATARPWVDATKAEPLTGALTAYIVDQYEYKGRPAYQSFLQVNGKWYKTSSAHIAFLLKSACETFGQDLLSEITGVKMYKIPRDRGEAAELEFILA